MSLFEADVLRGVVAPQEGAQRTATRAGRAINLRTWLIATIACDAVCAVVAGAGATAFRFGGPGTSPAVIAGLCLALPFAWVATLGVTGAYDQRWATTGAEPFRRVFNGGLALLATAAIASFLFKAGLSRQWVVTTTLLLTPLTLGGRYAGRKVLHRLMTQGRAIHSVLVAGSSREIANVVRHMRRAPYTGFSVLAVCQLDHDYHLPTISDVPAFESDLDGLLPTAMAIGADTIAVAGSESLPEGGLRSLAWKLEGSPVQLIVAPAVTDFAGPRIMIRPVDGLPMLKIDQPDFAGMRRVAKEVIDWLMAAGLLVALSPVFLAVCVTIAIRDGRPVFFKQERVGRHGAPFHIWKFRTMGLGAEQRRLELLAQNEDNGVLFKIRQDPRVTPTGRFLRRHSLDELPQLFNVLLGEMSLVGPRPPLGHEVNRFGSELLRRLLVKPGMTGLWQINGRTDLPLDEAMRLDLHYVENWSVALDLMVLWKTFAVVRHGKGGY